MDECYGDHDGLDRLLLADRGTLAGTHPDYTGVTGRTFKQQWTLESLGNWKAFQHDADGDGAYTGAGDLDQTRTHNAVNELTGISEQADPQQAQWVAPTYDAAGNMTSAPKPGPLAAGATRLFFQWDAWNRLSRVWQDSTTAGTLGTFEPGTHDPLVAEYRYDGRNYRIVKLVPHGGPAAEPTHWDRTDYYYNESWQVLEERFAAEVTTANMDNVASAVRIQWLWDLRYIDAPVCRFRDTNANGTLDETLYYCNDANMNVTALVDAASGNVVERYVYDPYGKPTFLMADWTLQEVDGHDDGEASAYGNAVLYCGYRHDMETDLFHVRNRYLGGGIWISRDPTGYQDGHHLYAYAGINPLILIDPSGTVISILERDYGPNPATIKWFSDAVVQALTLVCPCVTLEKEWVTVKRTRLDASTQKHEVVNTKYLILWGKHPPSANTQPQAEDVDLPPAAFCECLKAHTGGCTLLHDILEHGGIIEIAYTRDPQGRAHASTPTHTGLYPIQWNPEFPGWNTSAGDPAPGTVTSARREDFHSNVAAVLAHELTHAWDYLHMPKKLEPAPAGSQLSSFGYYIETQAVRAGNQIFGEMTGRTGQRTQYGATRIPNPQQPKFTDPCDCKKYWTDLPWGGVPTDDAPPVND